VAVVACLLATLAWGQRSFIQPQMMVEERTFYDPVAGKYTVDRYLDDLGARYGGIDSVLIWSEWQPHFPTRQREGGIHASRFPGEKQTLWLLVNRSDRDSQGEQLQVPAAAGMRYYDLWRGAEFKPTPSGQSATLSFEIEAHGYGDVLAVDGPQKPEKLDALLRRMADQANIRLGSLSAQWKPLAQPIVEIPRTKPAPEAPEGMVLIPAGKFRFKVSGVVIKGGDEPGVDVQDPWEDAPQRHRDREMEIASFYIDKHPVTNAQFKRFLDAAGYNPKDDYNFLEDWKDGTYPEGWERKPATWVFAGGCPGVCRVGGQASAARMGVAVRGPGHGWTALPVGEPARRRGHCQAGKPPRVAWPHRRGCLSARRQPIRRHGPAGERLAMDRRVRRRLGIVVCWNLHSLQGLDDSFCYNMYCENHPIRHTQAKHGRAVYAFLMAWPGDGARVEMKALGSGSSGAEIKGVALLGHPGELRWKQTADGLTVTLPDGRPCDHAFALKIALNR
jgi:hypothetical protein